MRISQITEAPSNQAKQSDIVARLQKAGGDVVGKATNNVGDQAVIGVNGVSKGKVYFVIYPDGTFDRFDPKQLVIYRTGYRGPSINDPEVDRYNKEVEKEERAERRERERERAKYRARDKLNQKREKLRMKYDSVVIPPQFKDLCDKADGVFERVMNDVGSDIRSGVSSYGDDADDEMSNYYDPDTILDLVMDRAYQYISDADHVHGGDDDEITPYEWDEFKDLPIKYQLKIAARWSGSMDY